MAAIALRLRRAAFKRATGMTPAEYRSRFASYRGRQPETADLAEV